MHEERKRYATVKQMPILYPIMNQQGIRWLIFNEKTNGFSCCVRRIGRKVVIDLDEFEKWIERQK